MIETVESTYIVPRGKGIGEPIILNISSIVKAEQRLKDVAIVNRQTAPELLSEFNKHWLTLSHNVSMLTYERNEADSAAKVAYSEAILDCTDELIKKRGHSKTSQDLREALATINPEVIASKERLNEIKTVLAYLTGKMQAFENAYNSVKKIVSIEGGLPPEAPTFNRDRSPFREDKDDRAEPESEQESPQYSKAVLDGFSDLYR